MQEYASVFESKGVWVKSVVTLQGADLSPQHTHNKIQISFPVTEKAHLLLFYPQRFYNSNLFLKDFFLPIVHTTGIKLNTHTRTLGGGIKHTISFCN